MNQAAHANDGALVTESPGTSSARGQAAKAAPNALASDWCTPVSGVPVTIQYAVLGGR